METPARTVCYPEIPTVAGMAPTAPLIQMGGGMMQQLGTLASVETTLCKNLQVPFQIQKRMKSDFMQSIFCGAQCHLVMLSTVGSTFKTPHLASGRQISAFILSTAWDLSRKELTPVYQRKWVTGKSWHSTNYSWGTRWLVYSQSQ